MMFQRPGPKLSALLAALSGLGGIVIYLATSRMGPGVSTDSAMILSAGENLLRGRGLVDYSGFQLTQFPPLYSLILALGSALFGQDIFVVGWVLNILVFGALVWSTGWLLYEAFPEQPILAIAGSLVTLTSTSLIQISSNVASDPLFMLMVIGFLMLATAYLRSGERRCAFWAVVLTILACFQRYAGLALVISGSLIAAYSARHDLRRAAIEAGVFAVLTGVPIFAWGYLHNAPVNGTVFGGRLPAVPALNFTTGAEKVLYWFIPYRIITSVGTVYLLGAILLIGALLVLATGATGFVRRAGQPEVVPSLAFLLVYFVVLVFDISYYELKGLNTDRVHIVALPALLIFISLVASPVLEAGRRRMGAQTTYAIGLLLLAAWSAYPISRSTEYVRGSMAHGDVSSYNSINKANIRQSQLARYLHGLDLKGRTVYSNGGDTAWFILRSIVRPVPTLASTDRADELRQRYTNWPGAGSAGYVLWINAEAHKTNYATPGELSTIADLQALYSDDAGSVYAVQGR
jgi:hypothetical protein